MALHADFEGAYAERWPTVAQVERERYGKPPAPPRRERVGPRVWDRPPALPRCQPLVVPPPRADKPAELLPRPSTEGVCYDCGARGARVKVRAGWIVCAACAEAGGER